MSIHKPTNATDVVHSFPSDDKTRPVFSQKMIISVHTKKPDLDVTMLAEAIINVSDAFEKIKRSNLAERAIVLLLHDLSKVNKGDIELILHNAPLLKKYFTKNL